MFGSLKGSPEKLVFCFSAALFVCVGIAAAIVGTSAIASLSVSFAFLATGALMARSQPGLAPVGAAVALIGQAIAFTATFQTHPWQLDSHMLFFALLACLVSLRSILALLVATTLIALHHLSLSFVMPALIYPSGDFVENIGRTVFHAVIVLVQTAALIAVVHRLRRADDEMRDKQNALEKSLVEAGQAQERAMASKTAAEAAHEDAIKARKRAEDALAQASEMEDLRRSAELDKKMEQNARQSAEIARTQEQQMVVDTLRTALTCLGTGDLTVRIANLLPDEYENLRSEFNKAVQTLEELVSAVAEKSSRMDVEIREISKATDDLARWSEGQADILGKTSATLDVLTKSVHENAASLAQAHQDSQNAQSDAKASGGIVSKAATAMGAIKTEAGKIANIVELIESISFQTNLLALNAGVEAARAGKAGAGFAVVASEVRSLAHRSSESATSIRTLIDRSGTEVENGSSRIAESVDSLENVQNAISGITGKMDQISDLTNNQSSQISALNSTLADMGTKTQENVAMFRATNAACANLSNGARSLRELTQQFQVSPKESDRHQAA